MGLQASSILEESSLVDQFALGSNTTEESVITVSDDDLVGEDDEVTSAFSGHLIFMYIYILVCVHIHIHVHVCVMGAHE